MAITGHLEYGGVCLDGGDNLVGHVLMDITGGPFRVFSPGRKKACPIVEARPGDGQTNRWRSVRSEGKKLQMKTDRNCTGSGV